MDRAQQLYNSAALAVTDMLANVTGESFDALVEELGLDVTQAGAVVLQQGARTYTVRLITVQRDYKTNLCEQTGKVLEMCQQTAGVLLSAAIHFYSRLRTTHAAIIQRLEAAMGDRAELLAQLRVDEQSSTLYLDPDGVHLGILVNNAGQ